MSYVKLYLRKSIEEVAYEDVEAFFSIEKDESDKLEFKSFGGNDRGGDSERENAVLKTVAGFLNSAGGLLIWGAPVGKNVEGKKEKVFVGELSSVSKLYEKDSFIAKIVNNITPSPNCVLFKRLEKDGKYIYLIDVQESEYRPHQYDGRYYMRIDGQTKVAPHHYVEALMKRISYPKLKGYISFNTFRFEANSCTIVLNATLFNMSKNLNEHKANYIVRLGRGAKFMNRSRQIKDRKYFDEGQVLVVDVKHPIYYNLPHQASEIIEFELHKMNNKCEFDVLLQFAGKDSPMRISHYTVKVPSVVDDIDYNAMLIQMNENQIQHELSNDSGLTEEDGINYIIGRC